MVERLREWVYQQDIKKALDALTSREVPSNSFASLRKLSLIDKFLADPAVPTFSSAREVAVFSLLSDTIQELLRHMRSNQAQPTPTEDLSRNIQSDVQTGSSLLIGVSILNYCYVHAELNLSIAEYAEIAGFSSRSAQRYLNVGMKKLEISLFEKEYALRSQLQSQKLLSQLPIGVADQLFGRSQEVNELNEILINQPHANTIVFGVGGVGKRTLVKYVLRKQILDGSARFERLVWVTQSGSYSGLVNEICLQLPGASDAESIRALSMFSPICVVIEGSESLLNEADQLRSVLSVLQFATCVVISDVTPKSLEFDHYFRLLEFNETVSTQLVYLILDRFNLQDPVDERTVEHLVAESRGNPGAIQRLVYSLSMGGTMSSATNLTAHEILRDLVRTCTLDEFRAWLALSVCQLGTFDWSALPQGWSNVLREEALILLVTYNILEPRGHHKFKLTAPGFYAMVEHIASDNPVRREETDASIRYIVRWLCAGSSADDANHIVALSRLIQWLPFSRKAPVLCGIPEAKLFDMLRTGSTKWDILLNHIVKLGWQLDEDNPLCVIFIVSCALIQAHQFDRAQLFIENWRQKPHNDEGLNSAMSLLECRLFKLSHQYELAFERLNRLRTKRRLPNELRAIALEELIALAIDLRDGELAHKYLKEVKHDSMRLQLLTAETLLIDVRTDEAIAILDALSNDCTDGRITASICDLYSRAYQISGENGASIYFALEASEKLGALGDVVAQARALCNLGVQLYDLGQFFEARYAWQQAEALQMITGDRIGLAITKRNQEMI